MTSFTGFENDPKKHDEGRRRRKICMGRYLFQHVSLSQKK